MNTLTSYQLLFSDVRLIDNISGGSGAQTWIVEDTKGLKYVRKWGLGPTGEKLKDQVSWLKQNSTRFHCPQVTNEGSKGELYFYDMNYIEPSSTLFQFAKRSDAADTAKKTLDALDMLQQVSFNYACGQDKVLRQKYLHEKLFLNIEKLCAADPDFTALSASDQVVVQGKPLKGFQKVVTSSNIKRAFESLLSEELFNFGHGDLTLSNMLFSENRIYFIDPNPAFLSISHCQEFSKVLQSTLTKYESFEENSSMSFGKDFIQYTSSNNPELAKLNHQIVNSDFFGKFDKDLLLLHLAVHLSRIMPYVYRNKDVAVVYFAEILKILNAIDSNESQAYLNCTY